MPLTHDTVAKSTTATRSTFQALHVLRISGGAATIVTNDAILQWQRKLAEEEGLYVEPASAGAIVAVAQLKAAGHIKAADKVVALLTASGLKDPSTIDSILPEMIALPASFQDAVAMLKERDIFPR